MVDIMESRPGESRPASRTCPTCGRALPGDAVFCGFDGTILTKPTIIESSNKVCPRCRKIYPSYALFCPVDSAQLVEEDNMRASRQQMQAMPAQQGTQAGSGTVDINSAKGGTTFMDNANLEAAPLTGAYLQSGDKVTSIGSETDGGEDLASSSPETDAQILATSGGYLGNLIGKTIDKYLIQSMLGEGGMAVVYKAHHTIMERTVVIKVMQGWMLSNQKSVERFMRECKVTAKLNHPNIVTVYDVGAINGKAPYLVMEYIKGESLADRLQRQGALSFNTTANIIIQICRGLQEAHNLGIIHRDLKPDNILLQDKSDRPDWVKIVDFGIAHFQHGAGQRLTKTGRMVGTPEYIAPEQLKDKPMDVRTDLYALGIMMYEMLTGKVPFDGESAESILMKHLLEEAPPMSVHKPEFKDGTPFDSIITKLLQKEPDARYQTATELRLDVEQALSQVRMRRS